MANLAASAVTVNRSFTFGGTNGRQIVHRNVTLVLTGQGGSSNLIPASVLGLSRIDGCTPAHEAGGPSLRVAGPSTDGANLHFIDVNQATDGNRHLIVDLTGITVTLSVWGPPA